MRYIVLAIGSLLALATWVPGTLTQADSPVAQLAQGPTVPVAPRPPAEEKSSPIAPTKPGDANPTAASDPAKALQDYIAKPDDSFRWTVRQRWTSGQSRGLELSLNSQTWRGGLWQHQLFIYCPATAKPGAQSICLIDGGSWKTEYTTPVDAGAEPNLPGNVKLLTQAAEMLGAPIVVIRQVPHQPLYENLYEDALISHTFMQYVKTGESDWPLLLPMVKSVVRGLDAAQAAAKQEWKQELPSFIVTGASKRGWTTWLTGSLDKRITGIAPMVIDVLNFAPQMAQQISYYGKFSERIHDYTDKGLPRFMLTPGGKNLLRIVDPFEYRDALKLPKLIILGTNDPYWTVDALNLYYEQLPGEKFVLYAPNQGHDIKDFPRLIGGIGGLYAHTSSSEKFPQLDWKYVTVKGQMQLQLTSQPQPREVTLWVAENTTRDFRQATFVPRKIDCREGQATIDLPDPATGYQAVFCEAQYDRKPYPLPLTTTIKVLGGAK